MLASPSDRGQGAKGISSAVGAKMIDAFFSVTNGDLIVLLEATKEQMAASMRCAVTDVRMM